MGIRKFMFVLWNKLLIRLSPKKKKCEVAKHKLKHEVIALYLKNMFAVP